MDSYYTNTLSGRNLRRCYDIAPDRIRQYLAAEIEFVRGFLDSSKNVLELGCGYGRVLREIRKVTPNVVGLDTSRESLFYSQMMEEVQLTQMDAQCTGFKDKSFDVVVCIQNGISAFKVNSVDLVRESLRITVDGGKSLFSTYSDRIWDERLNWFILQAEENLVGEIDWDRTERGTIVCKDGFVATTFSEADFHKIASELRVSCKVIEVDSSSLFGIFT